MTNPFPSDRCGGEVRPGVHPRHRTRVAGAVSFLASCAMLATTASLLVPVSASAAVQSSQRASAAGSLAAGSTASPAGDVRSPMFPAVVPTVDIVGAGLFNCFVATGEVGYSPTISSKGSKKVKEWVSIWFVATKCAGGSTTGAKPLPRTVIGSLVFKAVQGTVCPQFGYLGKGQLHLTYNYPDVPNPMIDPSYGVVTVTESGPYWELKGSIAGSYPTLSGPAFDAWLKPNPIGAQSCSSGLTSEYIARAQTPFLRNF